MAAARPRDCNRIKPRAITAQTARMMNSTGCHWLASAAEMAALMSGGWPVPAPLRWASFPQSGPGGVDARSVRAARNFTVVTLHRWGAQEHCDDIAIVVSELLTNALQHARPARNGTGTGWPVRVGLLYPGHCVVCAVADPCKAPPVPGKPGDFCETGRGLGVIAELSDQWGYTDPCDSGKVTWAMFSAQASPPPEPERYSPVAAAAGLMRAGSAGPTALPR